MPFDSPHNKRLTWDHLLRQVSDWEGTLWGKPEWADRPAQNAATWTTRARVEPGSAYEYNDTRVNVLALAALQVWRKPLPEVLKERIMDPIGASNTWRWYGYDNIVDRARRPRSAECERWRALGRRDGAQRVGHGPLRAAHQRRGLWGDKRLLSDAWVTQALTPTPAQKTYGYMNWFVNPDGQYLKSATPKTFAHVGNGTNIIIVIPEHDLVIVSRWIANGAVDGLVQRVLAAVK
jgi:CubicO group peptidase (beta-lactamase class C family)